MTVTVYIPTKNRVELLRRAVASLHTQSYRDWECIIVDDGSDDETPTFLTHLVNADKRFRIIRNETSVGACVARNMAIEHSRTVYVSGLDDDDMFMPNRLQDLLAAVNPAVSLVSSNDIIVGGRRGAWTTNRRPTSDANAILRRNSVGNQALFLKDRAIKLGGFNASLLSSQDYDFWIRMIDTYGQSICLEKPSQIIFAEADRARITTSSLTKRLDAEQKIFKQYAVKMRRPQRFAHQAKILSKEGDPRSLLYAIGSFDFSSEGISEFINNLRSLQESRRYRTGAVQP